MILNQFMFITFFSRIKESQLKTSTHVISMVDSNC